MRPRLLQSANLALGVLLLAAALGGCANGNDLADDGSASSEENLSAALETSSHEWLDAQHVEEIATSEDIGIVESFRPSLSHGSKGAEFQKYIVLHDTEGDSDPMSVVNWWESNGNLIAAQFVIGKDGTIVQCVSMDEIAHHAGFGDTGHNDMYGIVEDGRDDMAGTSSIGSWASDYGMNAWSIGIELVHTGTDAPYPEEQLEALDRLIAHIDAYYGFESQIIDHKAWRSGNSDTSPAFREHLAQYQTMRRHA